ALDRAATQLRARQNLRRRLGQLEQDPFASLDTSKRQMLVAGPRPRPSSAEASQSKGSDSAGPGAATDPARTAAPPTAAPPRPVAPTRSPTREPVAPAPPGGQTPTDPRTGVSAPAGPAVSPPPPPPVPPGPVARALLDPAAIAELRRAEAAGQPLTELEKMER